MPESPPDLDPYATSDARIADVPGERRGFAVGLLEGLGGLVLCVPLGIVWLTGVLMWGVGTDDDTYVMGLFVSVGLLPFATTAWFAIANARRREWRAMVGVIAALAGLLVLLAALFAWLAWTDAS